MSEVKNITSKTLFNSLERQIYLALLWYSECGFCRAKESI